MANIEQEIAKIQQRNRKVEADKAWETSLTRLVLVSVITYVFASLLLIMIQVNQPFLGALVPTAGFILSTQSIPFAKKMWLKHCYKNKNKE